ncbi:MAG TPA: S-adenosylmethionine:tRNA ribosyltransferase-isomerase [Burkholderiaceae bacterium]|nr:S-adenosylmethionine:tRNA ribosyltransferase-isomerase [Burkholderiaceae bacterium]
MIAAHQAVQRPSNAKLLIIDGCGHIRHALRRDFIDFLQAGDLVIANDASTLPASLQGIHEATGAPVEVRLAGSQSFAARDFGRFSAILFGAGDFRTRTEDRLPPPAVAPGERLLLGPLIATIESLLNHPRLVALRFGGTPDTIWAGLARHGKPIQYAHIEEPLAMWDVWTPIAGMPVAFEPPSAGFTLDWQSLAAMGERGVEFATITHAAGISSTGDDRLDKRLPFNEPYRIPATTADAIRRTRMRGGRVIAIGTTVVRAIEHSALCHGQVRSGEGMATQRIGAGSRLHVIDAILSGTHEAGTSHYQLLRAFTDNATLGRADEELEAHAYRTHEFGDSVLIERRADCGAQAEAA